MSLGRSAPSQRRPLRQPLMAIERYVWQRLGRSRDRLLLLWLLGGTTGLALLIWNWRLVVAAGSGAGAMALAHWLQQQDLRAQWREVSQKLQGPQRQLAIAALAGSATAFSTYLMASVWAATENHWLATASIAQGTGVMGLLALVGWQAMQRPLLQVDRAYDRLLWRLTAANPLDRLMAVRQLTRHYRRYPRSQQRELEEYFLMLLADEVHPKVRSSLLRAIDQFQDHQREGAPLNLPLHLKTPCPDRDQQQRELQQLERQPAVPVAESRRQQQSLSS